LFAHVAVSTEQGPLALPMAYGCSADTMYLHGAVGNAVLGAATDAGLCATVTLLDGLVLARTAFHNSMNYRSVVVRGEGRRVTDPAEHELALQLISDHVVPTWSSGRAASASEIRRTLVLALPLDEASAKFRAGDPVDEPEDLDGPFWAGTVAVSTTFGPPVAAADLHPGIPTPQPVLDRFA
jgi:nitroimidazol reductase NimA-like FMN-containing flavoprotein (pyridoxamine 5'-phosphate oxidase superfamily)